MDIIISLPVFRVWPEEEDISFNVFVDKTSVSLFLAAAGSKLNVSALPLLLSYEGDSHHGTVQSALSEKWPLPQSPQRALAANSVPQNPTV